MRYKILRRYVRVRSWWWSNETLGVRNAMFWSKNPRMYLHVRRRVSILKAGRGYLDA